MSIRIRSFQIEDVPAVAAMEQEIFSLPWSEKAFAELLTREYCLYLVAELDGQIVAFAGLTDLCGEGDIDKVMTRQEFRGRKIAYTLLCELVKQGRERGITAYTLEVRAGNEPAIRLYEKLGFVSEGIRPGFYEKPVEDAVIMWLRP